MADANFVNQIDNRRDSEFNEKIVQVSRFSEKTKGGNKIGFSALAVVGDGKGPDVASAIRKGVLVAKRNMIEVPIINGTIPFEFYIKLGAAKILIKPAPPGSGVIAGGAVRSVVTAAGIRNISSKVLGTKNKASNVYGAIEALRLLSERYNREQERKNGSK